MGPVWVRLPVQVFYITAPFTRKPRLKEMQKYERNKRTQGWKLTDEKKLRVLGL